MGIQTRIGKSYEKKKSVSSENASSCQHNKQKKTLTPMFRVVIHELVTQVRPFHSLPENGLSYLIYVIDYASMVYIGILQKYEYGMHLILKLL